MLYIKVSLDNKFSVIGKIVRRILVSISIAVLLFTKIAVAPNFYLNKGIRASFNERSNLLIKLFKSYFPDRKDNLSQADLYELYRNYDLWNKLLPYYDLVHAYATDGVYPLIAGKSYIAYEHGTLRNIPFAETLQGRCSAISYKLANHVCITNCDTIKAAKKLGLSKYSFVPHPVNEEFYDIDGDSNFFSEKLHTDLSSDFIVLHPSRQHWSNKRDTNYEKGNDILIKGFEQFIQEVDQKATAIFIEWGSSIDESKNLIDKLGISSRIIWIPVQPNRQLVRYILATDLLADQFYIGAFGSTMPKALMCRKPAMLYINEEAHRWCLEKMPPVINVKNEKEVFLGLKNVYLDKNWRDMICSQGKEWYDKYHSNNIIERDLSSIYKKALDATALR